MITVEQHTPGELILSFKYFQEYIDRVKSLGAKYEPNTKTWRLDQCFINALDHEFSGELFYKTPRWEITGEKPPDYSSMYKFDTKANIDELGFKLKPFPYQNFGIRFIVDRLLKDSMAFICDDVGLGKTIQAIGGIQYVIKNDLVKDIMIICKKSLKSQWADEIAKFVDVDADIYVVPDNKVKRHKMYQEIKANPRVTITIVNYHIVLNDSKLLKPDFTIYDEVHVAKKHDGKINGACKEITKNALYCLFMTGTPIMSKPEDLYGIVSIKDKKYFGGSYAKFEKRYLVKSYGNYVQTVGCRNLDELRDKTQRLILRRTASEVTIDLPDVLEIDKYVDMDSTQKDVLNFVGDKSQDTLDRIEKLKSFNSTDEEIKKKIEMLEGASKGYIAIEQIIANNPRLFHFSKSEGIRKTYAKFTPTAKYVSPKFTALLDIVEEIKEANQKVIIFSKYETVVKYLVDFLDSQKIKGVAYFGQLSGDEREKVINEFKYNDTVTAIVGTDAMAEGLNLQMANVVINLDLAYNQAIHMQRIGRARRAGSRHKTVIVYNLLTRGTIDEKIYNKIKETKQSFDVFVSANKAQSKALRELSN
jgi:SNF2 family DNA or RNA helicase